MENKTYEEIVEDLGNENPEAVLWTGYEKALIGSAHTFGKEPVALYDYDKCIQILMDRDSMTELEAEEFFQFNTLGCHISEHNPIVFMK